MDMKMVDSPCSTILQLFLIFGASFSYFQQRGTSLLHGFKSSIHGLPCCSLILFISLQNSLLIGEIVEWNKSTPITSSLGLTFSQAPML